MTEVILTDLELVHLTTKDQILSTETIEIEEQEAKEETEVEIEVETEISEVIEEETIEDE